MGELFGTDGIRGRANVYPMDVSLAAAVGRVVAHLARNGWKCSQTTAGGETQDGLPRKVVLGRDTRLSGPMLQHAVASGLMSGGAQVLDAGVIPTPGLAFLVRDLRAAAGIMISASHNPFLDNGIKIFASTGFKLNDSEEEQVETLVAGKKATLSVPPETVGTAHEVSDACGRYGVFLKHTLPRRLSLSGLRVAVDCANGATYAVAPMVLAELGVDVVVLNDHPNGQNINLNCGSEHTEMLSEAVHVHRCVAGLALDGDGDRLIVVDENGARLTGDQTLLICALELKRRGLLAGDAIVSTIMSNMGLAAACRRYGLRHYMSQVGDRRVLEEMLRVGAVLGGEESGHTIFLNYHTTGDGILTALQLLAAMVVEQKPMSELAAYMDVYPHVLVNVEISRKPDLASVPELQDAIKEVEKALGGEGRVLVRYSGTEPLCRVMVEGPNQEEVERHCRALARVVEAVLR